jgi:hypothetical protein
MKAKTFLKAFLAGMAFPAVFMPIAYTIIYVLEPHAIMRMHTLQFVPMYIPLLWGFTNVLYAKMSDGISTKKADVSLWFTGACLGFVVAVLGVFVLQVPALVLGLSRGYEYLPLVLLPFIYGVIFRFVVKYLNKTLVV